MATYNDFLAWERASRDTIDFKTIYADMAEDTLGGLVLSQIVYWHLPSKTGDSRLRIEKEGKKWMACARSEWWETTRLTPRQVDRVLNALAEKQLIEKKVFRFNGTPVVHIRINQEVFMQKWQMLVDSPPVNPFVGEMDITESLNPILPNGEIENNQTVKSLTESTQETTQRVIAPLAQSVSPVGNKPAEPKPYYDAIAEVLDIHGGQNVDMQKMLEGNSKKKGYSEYNMSPPVSLEEFRRWGVLAKAEYKDFMIKAPAKVNGSITKMRQRRNQAAKPASIPVSVTPILPNLATDGVVQFNRAGRR